MFVGHLSVALAGNRLDPGISLGTWTLAAVLADLLAFPLLLAGVESFRIDPGVATNRILWHAPYSHSLLMDSLWAALFAGGYFLLRRSKRGACLLFAAVLSHWVLDVVSHRPDMQLAPAMHTILGLGLWNSLPATLFVEGGLWLAAVILCRARTFIFWIGIALFTLLWIGNVTRGADPNPTRAGIGGLVVFSLIIAWAYWTSRSAPDAAQGSRISPK